VSADTATDYLTFEATVPMTREALVALVRRRARLWGILPGFGEVRARRTKDGFTLRIDDLKPGSSWTLLEAAIEDRGATCRVHGRVGRDPRLRRRWLWSVALGVVFYAIWVHPSVMRILARGDATGLIFAVLYVALWATLLVGPTLYLHVFPPGVARREPADRAFLIAWLEHKIGVPVTVRAGSAAG
jgi:hypothetical protein